MVVCASGSAPNNSSLGVVEISGPFLNSVLPGGLQWFDSYLWLMEPFTIDVPAFCGAEPPALPTLGADDLLSIITGGRLGTAFLGIQKARQLMSVYAWYQMCHCISGGTPAAPTPPSEPSGAPVVNPPGIGNVLIPCDSFVSQVDPVPPSTFVNQVSRILPPLAASVDTTMHNNVAGAGAHLGMQFAWAFYDAGIHPLKSGLFAALASGASRTDTLSVPANAYRFDVSAGAGPSTTSNTAQSSIAVFCDYSVPPRVDPPDPETSGLLRQILNLVTLIQRQAVPFAYVTGTVHSSLTGAGVLSVQGLIGAKVEITTDPATLGEAGSSPVELFDRGFLTWGTDDGYPQSFRLERTLQVSLPPRCSVFTELAYDLHPGVTVTITELIREP